MSAAALAAPNPEVEHVGDVSIFRIEGVREFADATVPGAVRRACAQDLQRLEAFLASREAKIEPSLIRRGHGLPYCHIFYEPTVRGFRASADDEPITGVFSALEPAGIIAGRKPLGDNLEILKRVLEQAPQPVRVTLTINREYDQSTWPAAVERHFGSMPHQVETRPSRAEGTQPWAQDYVKAGWAVDEQKLLVPHRLFEGRAEDGDIYRPLLDGLEEGRLVRSKLSWEGGDLQFARDPNAPSRLILFHGGAARAYWGKDLDDAEYAYVLRTEFGADVSIDLSGLSAHVDYVVTLLPGDGAVLLTKPVRGDADLARAAVAALSEAWGAKAPTSLGRLSKMLATWKPRTETSAVREQIDKVRRDISLIEDDVEPALAEELDAYTSRHCPGSDACFEGEGRAAMLERNPALLKRALDGIADVVVRAQISPRLLGVIEAQLRREAWPRELLLDRKAHELESLGFRVIRIPRLAAENAENWPGVSYANSLVWDQRIFVPALGLGDYEERLFGNLGEQLPGYEIVPVPARYALMHNGGVHCVFGLVRAKPEL